MGLAYKIEFEAVLPYADNGRFYKGERPVFKPDEVPGKHWTKCKHTTDDPWQQYNQLRAWAASGEQLVRNVKLFSGEPTIWIEVPPP